MSWKKEAFEEATEKVREMIEEKETKPTTSSDTGRSENERGHTNISPPENER